MPKPQSLDPINSMLISRMLEAEQKMLEAEQKMLASFTQEMWHSVIGDVT